MIRINLVAKERKAVKQKVAFDVTKQIPLVCCGIIVLTLLIIGWRFRVIAADGQRVDDGIVAAQKETTRLHAIITQVRQFEQRKAALQQRVTLIEQLRSQQVGPVRMLDQVSLALPPTVWLLELKQTATANEVLIDGKAMALTGLTDFVTGLERSGYFEQSVEIVNSTTEMTGQDEIIKFEIKGTFKDPSAPAPAPGTTTKVKAKS